MRSAVAILLALSVVILGSVTVSASDPLDPEPSFEWTTAAPPICGLYPGWQPGDEFGPGDVVECPPDEFPIGPNPSGLEPDTLAPAPATPRPTPIVVGQPSPSTVIAEGSEIPAVWSSDLPATDTENVGGCGEQGMPERFNGQTNSTGVYPRSGVKALLLLDQGFDDCTFNFSNGYGGVAAYIELSPKVQPSQCQPTGCAIRLGVIKCGDGAGSTGGVPGAPPGLCTPHADGRAFYQSIGCSQVGYVSGSPWADFNKPIEFSMYDTGTDVLRLSIGGVTVVNLSFTSNRINCWIDDVPAKAVWMGRKYDGPGDSLGLYPAPGINFTDARFGLLNQGWFTPAWGLAQCEYEQTSFGDDCWTSGGDNLYVTTN